MCGRFGREDVIEAIEDPPTGRKIRAAFEAPLSDTYNLAPTQSTPVILNEDNEWVAKTMRWMIVGPKITHPNTRAASLAKWPKFFAGFDRVLIPVSGYYEWPTLNGREHAFYFRPAGKEKHWWVAGVAKEHDLRGVRVRSFNVVITDASKDLEELHDTMPAILSPKAQEVWLDPSASHTDLVSVLKPLPEGAVDAYEVSLAVGNIRNNSPDLIKPLH